MALPPLELNDGNVTADESSMGTPELVSVAPPAGMVIDASKLPVSPYGEFSVGEDGKLYFTQTSPFDHTGGPDTALAGTYTFTVKDSNGKSHSLDVNLSIKDGNPSLEATAPDSSANRLEGTGESHATGGFTLDYGADGAATRGALTVAYGTDEPQPLEFNAQGEASISIAGGTLTVTSLGNGQYGYSFDAGTGTQAGDHSSPLPAPTRTAYTARDTITVKVENIKLDAVDDGIYTGQGCALPDHRHRADRWRADFWSRAKPASRAMSILLRAQAARSSAVSTPPATARSAKTTRCSRKPKPTFSGVSSPTTTAIRSASAT